MAKMDRYTCVCTALLLVLAAACGGSPETAPSPPTSTSTATVAPTRTATPAPSPTAIPAGAEGLSPEEIATLGSLAQLDEFPLYTMHFVGAYPQLPSLPSPTSGVGPSSDRDPSLFSPPLSCGEPVAPGLPGLSAEAERSAHPEGLPASALGLRSPLSTGRLWLGPGGTRGVGGGSWACSLFAALGDPESRLYGRNFDWEYSPALLLFTDPADGYASVSMVDMVYLGLTGDQAMRLLELPLNQRTALLYAPSLPFDGMNEKGLAVGMAAVGREAMPDDPNKPTIDSLGIVREMLDHAADVDEALALLESYNIDWTGGPPLHYLIADRSGQAALVEFYHAKLVVHRNQEPWHVATNFIVAKAQATESVQGTCPRYDRLQEGLAKTAGVLDPQGALTLLDAVTQDITQWSIVYGMTTGEIQVVVGQAFDRVYTLQLPGP